MVHKTAAVIGGGPAGLACAQTLAAAGVTVDVLEKSRGLGGRTATRRVGDLTFDHGAQYVTARGRGFRAMMQNLLRDGAAAVWRPRLQNGATPPEDWHVGAPSMNRLLRPLAAGVTVRLETQARAIRRANGQVWIDLDQGDPAGPYDVAAIAVPAPQAQALLAGFGAPFDRIAHTHMAPCWTLMAAFDAPSGLGVDLLRPAAGPLQWAARDNSRPGRAGGIDRWTLHAGYDWSGERLEWTPEAVIDALASTVSALLEASAAPTLLQAHRWRYALADEPLGQTCLLSEDGALGACGDWCLAPRVESAFDSGQGLGEALVAAMGAARA